MVDVIFVKVIHFYRCFELIWILLVASEYIL
jgi:hypothetical protein